MAELKLFEIRDQIKERTSSEVTLEKNLQILIENNMELFFGVRFLKSEYVITNGRMDSIGIDENNSPVIFEYKRSTSDNVPDSAKFESVKMLKNSVITRVYGYFTLSQNFTQWVK